MGLNRNLLMGQSIDLKNIKAMMTVGTTTNIVGFKEGIGTLSPNPLPNGVLVTACYFSTRFNLPTLLPKSIKSCTINNITFNHNNMNREIVPYLKDNRKKTIPVIFHFE